MRSPLNVGERNMSGGGLQFLSFLSFPPPNAVYVSEETKDGS